MKTLFNTRAARLIAAIVLVAGCSTNFIPPQQHSKEIRQQYDIFYQKAWDAVLDFVTAPGYKLDQVSKDSGYISIAHKIRTGSNEMDCGKFDSGGAVTVAVDNSLADIAVRLKMLANNRSEVTVIVTGERIIRGSSTWDGSYFERTFQCESTGIIERAILSAVEKYN